MTTSPQLRPLSLGEILDRTFQFYRQGFLVFIGISLVPQLALFAFSLLNLQFGITSSAKLSWLLVGDAFLAIFVATITRAVSQAATSAAVSDLYLGEETSINKAYGRIRGSYVRMVLIMMGLGLYMALGYICFVIPGIYLTLSYALAIPAAVIEGLTFSECRARSGYLTDGAMGRMFVIFAMVYIITQGVDLGITNGFKYLVGSAVSSASMPLMRVQVLIDLIANTFVEPLAMIGFTIAYYDQRVRKEGFDLDFMMASREKVTAAGAGDSL